MHGDSNERCDSKGSFRPVHKHFLFLPDAIGGYSRNSVIQNINFARRTKCNTEHERKKGLGDAKKSSMMENITPTKRSYSRSEDSDDSGDVIIVKTREPMHSTTQREQKPVLSVDPKCLMKDFQNCSKNSSVSNGTTAVEYPSHLQATKDFRENENSDIDSDYGGECDTGEEEEVIGKVRRDRIKEFPLMSEKVDSPPIKSCKNCDLRTSKEGPPQHEGKESTARNQDRILTEDCKDEMNQNTSKKRRKKLTCNLTRSIENI